MMVFHGYLVLIGTFVLSFSSLGLSYATSIIIVPPLQESFPDSTGGAVASFCTIQYVAALVSSLVGGALQDALDAANLGLHWLFFGGGLLMLVGLICSSVAQTLLCVLLASIPIGFGMGICGYCSAVVCVLWFEEARSTMLLLAISGQGIGSMFYSWAIVKMLNFYEEYSDDPWRPTMRWIGVISFFLCSVASTAMRNPFPNEVENHEKGANKAVCDDEIQPLQPSRDPINRRRPSSVIMREQFDFVRARRDSSSVRRPSHLLAEYRIFSRSSFVQVQGLGRQSSMRRSIGIDNSTSEEELSLRDALLSRTCIFLNLFCVVTSFTVMNMLVLLPSYSSYLGMPPETGGLAVALYGLGNFFSNVSLGVVADRIGARIVLAFSFFSLAALFFIWPLCTTPFEVYLVGFLFGFFEATDGSLPLVILADAFANTNSEEILTLNGVTNMSWFLGLLFGPTLATSLMKSKGYAYMAICSGIIQGVGTIMLLFIPKPSGQSNSI